jgi:hypothetical protein
MTNSMRSRREETLDLFKRLMDRGDTDAALLGMAEHLQAILAEFQTKLSSLDATPPFDRDLVLRCIAYKTCETWSAMLNLVKGKQAHAAMPLLRPMTEEMIFAHFLLNLPKKDVTEYLHVKTQIELLEKQIAQNRFFPAVAAHFKFGDIDTKPPNDKLIKQTRQHIKEARKHLQAITKREGWPPGSLQTVRDMARVCDMEPYYDFIYRASSSAVHASLHELGRMVWGNSRTGNFEVSCETFQQYYFRFAIVYGGWVASITTASLAEHFRSSFPWDASDSLSMIMAFFIKPSIYHEAPGLVTPEELNWNQPHDAPRSGA